MLAFESPPGDVAVEVGSSGSCLVVTGVLSEEPQPHFCFRGMAAVMASARPHEHRFDDG